VDVFAVAEILAHLGLDCDTLTASLLYGGRAHLGADRSQWPRRFGDGVVRMVEDLERIGAAASVSSLSEESAQTHSEDLRRMLLSIAEDVRVVLIVLAERLHQMRVIKDLPESVRRPIARETLHLYSPLANRLGIWQVKWELEDLCLRYLEPDEYKRIAGALDGKRQEREGYVAAVIDTLQAKCREAGLRADITGRPKHIYSIWRKMRRKSVDIDRIFDLLAVRVLVDSVADCYAVLGIVHGLWRYIPGEFDDYIATPKANMYRSLHTAVIGPEDKPLEVQIRTTDMHRHAELGVAAHWRYKENRGQDAELERRILWMRHWLELREEADSENFVENFKAEFEPVQVYVFTPKGKVVELPRGSTAVDFAYAIHSDVGHRCRGARVDGRIVPLNQPLRSGQAVEILTVKEGGPSRDWLTPRLGYVSSAKARNRIRQWFKQQDYDEHVHLGRAALERELSRLAVPKQDLDRLAQRFNFQKSDDLYAAIGRGDVSPIQAANALQQPQPRKRLPKTPERRAGTNRGEVMVEGVEDLMTHMARCCKPVPYDAIVGYITRGRGVTVHRRDCAMIRKMDESDRSRLVRVVWSGTPGPAAYAVDIQVMAGDRKGLLRDISSVLTNEDVDVLGVKSQSNRRTDTAGFRFTVEIADMEQLGRILDRIQQLPEVLEARRVV
ncbi:MAG: bifunctional (p)ppGpp synthetase/guanosine-3',5'-bis(diphosphate) 3'-pyrophosphohydrolase, partial [Chromatiales bacterium]|jgi:GTP pyrophosphokinase